MATSVKTPTRARARTRHEPTAAEHLNDALVHLLRAIPVGHLDERLTEAERWIGRLEKDLAKALAPRPRPPVRRPVAKVATRRAAPARRHR